MLRFQSLLGLCCFLQIALWNPSLNAEERPEANDLAFAFPLTALSTPSPEWQVSHGQQLFPSTWFESLERAYASTSVGDDFGDESPLKTWRVVSARIAVCAPLGKTPASDTAVMCWPELRLVWQPIQRKIRLHEIYMEASADDRAVHAIYPLDPYRHLKHVDAERAQKFLQKIQRADGSPEAMKVALSPQERADFIGLQQQIVKQFVQDAIQLRSSRVDATMLRKPQVRPEFDLGASEERAFTDRLRLFLDRYADPEALRQLTSFSLPGGREPAHLDEWIFVAFRGDRGKIVQEPIEVYSARDGRRLIKLSGAMRGSMLRDDERIYDLLNESPEAKELGRALLLFDVSHVEHRQRIADRNQLLVANTSCVSCHKLNDLRFDFHNFGYLEDRELTVSPRVAMDVAWDLRWLQVDRQAR